MGNHSSPSVLKGAFILTVAGLLSKILSAGYRVPLQNITGDLGFYIYQQVYPILGLAIVLSLYGFPAAISKLVSEITEEKRSLSVPSFYLPVFCWLMGICGSIFIVGFTQAPLIADVMGDEKLIPSLRSAFYVFLIVPFVSLFRGVFQGSNQMKQTAVSQVIEQIIRVTIIILTAVLVMKRGNMYAIGIGASAASFLGAVGALMVLAAYFKHSHNWTFKRWSSSFSYIKPIFFYGLFICFNYMLLLSFQMVDSLTLIPGLRQAGVELETARIWKGIFDRGQPLIQLGTVLASSVALAVIPSVTRTRFVKNRKEVERYVFASTKFSLIIALGAAVGLIVLFPSINALFFQDTEGTGPLRILMLVIIFSSVSITTSSVLQGLGYVSHTAVIVISGVFIKYLMNAWLIPVYELKGAAFATIIAAAFVLFGNIVILGKDYSIRKWAGIPWVALLAALTGMAGLLTAVTSIAGYDIFESSRLGLLAYTLTLTAAGAGVYFILLLRLGAFFSYEVKVLPFHKWLIRLLPKGMKQ
ncbi:polysaccharide biosynthesis protein [Halobacillus halophilus]|uniref:putative polysaccharide biosynthesis protein n=1 Tax=Halobacillus halophilus TaxID=1570 RepID=UPI001CD1DC64|nr:polysaccharide biosynthesis protein [Halobacillus halophilus]MCA1012982.1 polysaccharide biosynthesis protein [Halobacillus halophilus]